MIKVGSRVQLAAYLDLWMRGARFGVVESYAKAKYTARNGIAALTPVARVRLDALPNKLVSIFVTDLTEVEE